MAESEYRLLIHEAGPNLNPVPRIVTRPWSRKRAERKTVWLHFWELGMGIFPVLILGTFFGIWLALHRPPMSYAKALDATPQQEMRPQLIAALEQNTSAIVNPPEEQQSDEWTVEFSQMQLNSWLAERFPHLEGEWRDIGLKEPRMLISSQSIDVGFRIEQAGEDKYWSISVIPEVRGPQQVVLHLLAVRLGLFPIPLDQVHLAPEGIVHGQDWELPWKYSEPEHSITIDLPESSGIPHLSGVEVLTETIRFRGKTELDSPPEETPKEEEPPQDQTPANPEALTPTEPGK